MPITVEVVEKMIARIKLPDPDYNFLHMILGYLRKSTKLSPRNEKRVVQIRDRIVESYKEDK